MYEALFNNNTSMVIPFTAASSRMKRRRKPLFQGRRKISGTPLRGILQKYPPMSRRNHYHVYVIELSKDVLYEGRFKRCNPDYIPGKPCVYVGMTGLDPDLRFDKHKAGIQSNRYVQEYGLRLLPDLYEGFNPMSYDEAKTREVEIGIDLRGAGFGVWQA